MPSNPATRRKRRIILIVILVILTPIAYAVYSVAYTLNGIPDAYAKWDTATLLIEYMEKHDGHWPTGWDDLNETYTTIRNISHGGMWGSHTFDELKSRIGIDWHADPTALANAPGGGNKPPFRVVWALSGNTTVWSSSEPNELVWYYLREKRNPPQK